MWHYCRWVSPGVYTGDLPRHNEPVIAKGNYGVGYSTKFISDAIWDSKRGSWWRNNSGTGYTASFDVYAWMEIPNG